MLNNNYKFNKAKYDGIKKWQLEQKLFFVFVNVEIELYCPELPKCKDSE